MMTKDLKVMLETHPCYNEHAHTKFARMHLPVAPRCNIQCNYCNRKYDCTNESRPGVTSEVLTPEQAVEKVHLVRTKIPHLSVIGIAGPGDPLANEETFTTLELLKEDLSDLTFCLSTNGLNLPQNIDRLKALDVNFITVTMNAIDPDVGAQIYDLVRFKGRRYQGPEAAKLLRDQQIDGIRRAADAGMLVKVNSVLVPGVNADHLPAVAKKAKDLGAHIVNILPLIPVPGTKFEALRAPTANERKQLMDLCEVDIRQMRHCRQCRADAIGLLGEDRSAEFAHYTCTIGKKDNGVIDVRSKDKSIYQIAVATSNGLEVDLHFGHAERFRIYRIVDDQMAEGVPIDVTEKQEIPLFGPGHRTKIENSAERLKGVDAVVSIQYGTPAVELLKESGIVPLIASGSVEDAVRRAMEIIMKKYQQP
jgi:nitrogen fixation protein NifB